MAEDVKPTLDEGEPQNNEPQDSADVDGLLAELEAAGVSNRDQLQGKLRASREAGQLAQMLGETRRQNEELKQMLQGIQSQPRQSNDYDDYNGSQPIDLEASIEKTIDRYFSKKERAQQEAQQRIYQQWSRIQSDEDYHLVREVWEEKTKDPNFAWQIQSGAVDPVDEYGKVVRQFYKGLAVKAAGSLKQMRSGGKTEVKPPHVEGQSEVARETPQDKTEKEEYIGSLKDRVEKGGSLKEDEQLKALEAILRG